jgi:hypothetical protein
MAIDGYTSDFGRIDLQFGSQVTDETLVGYCMVPIS